ncbi:Hypothetical predicted protein, partial [Mytilus galloprovincialis]
KNVPDGTVIDVISNVDVQGNQVCNKKTGECPGGRCAEEFWGTRCQLSNNCFYNGEADNYMGTVAVSYNNYTCMKWVEQFHFYTEVNFPDGTMPENFCRTAKDFPRPWCYTTDHDRGWEHCNINNCTCPAGLFGYNCEYECHCADQSEACGSISGKCSSGCAEGWHGLDCQNTYVSQSMDKSTCPACQKYVLMERLVIAVISNVDVTGTKYATKRQECPERRCAEGFWGTRCQLYTVTLYNDTCQRWETQNPHPHHYKVTDFPDQAWPENFCRATPDSHRPWCYTTNKTNRFDYCDINNCSTYIKSSRAKASSDT